MGCNCGKSNLGARSVGRGVPSIGTPRTFSKVPPVPTPAEHRILEMQQIQRPQPGIGENKAEQERQRRLTVLRALGHA
jgi:hypothetical protein